jgi:predicted nucleic-acid-binding protein
VGEFEVATGALDTNVLIRFLIKDDPRQSSTAVAFVERSIRAGEELFISDVVLCETAWVLSASYRIARAEIARTFTELMRARNVAFASVDQLSRALHSFASGKGDFADYIIREQARAAGCDEVATFDRDLLRERGFRLP